MRKYNQPRDSNHLSSSQLKETFGSICINFFGTLLLNFGLIKCWAKSHVTIWSDWLTGWQCPVNDTPEKINSRVDKLPDKWSTSDSSYSAIDCRRTEVAAAGPTTDWRPTCIGRLESVLVGWCGANICPLFWWPLLQWLQCIASILSY